MTETIEDRIVREITFRAPKERVYAAISEPEQLARWFPEGVEGTLEAGARPILDFGKYGRVKIYIVAAEPHHYFAYRWVSGSQYIPDGFLGDCLAQPNTLVEFFLEDAPEGCRLRLVESGFASLPPAIAAANLKDNQGGWDYELARLVEYVG
jgi:uncharacterized protein YndB with AHSA1/START domain